MDLDEKTLRLIAVGASVSANCQSCLQANAAKAIQAGLQEQDIAKAIQIGKMIRQGAAAKMDKFALELSTALLVPEDAAESDCGCSSQTQWKRSPKSY
jgi:AhpD family alkylhydroperoxidase